jgi:hypothetical protein
MGKERLDVYMTDAQKKALFKVSKKTGISASRLLLKGFNYWLSNNPEDLKEEAEVFNALMEEREAKDLERETGDYLGSFDKYYVKMERIDSAYEKGYISKEERDRLRKKTKNSYSTTQRNKRIRLGMATQEDRKIAFAKKRGLKVTKSGKIKKA